jgi:hypothetical protein
MSSRNFRRTKAPAVAVLAVAAAALAGCGAAAAAGSHSHPIATSAAATAGDPAAVAAPATKASSTKAPVPAPPKVLLSLSGSGIANSPPFLVAAGTLTVHYGYSCASFGTSGNFVADLQSGNQGSLSSDDQPVANALGSGGSATTTIYPQNPGSDYHLAVNSECDWNVIVWSGVVNQTPPATTPAVPPAAQTPPATTPAAAPAVTDPWAVVSAFYGDITSKDYAGAWALLGFDPNGASYAAWVVGYANTGAQTVTEISESGDQVSFNLTSNNPDETVQTYTGTDTVQNGRIVAASVVQTG